MLVHHKVRPNSLVINSMMNNSKYGCLRTIHLSLFMKIKGKILGHFLYHERATNLVLMLIKTLFIEDLRITENARGQKRRKIYKIKIGVRLRTKIFSSVSLLVLVLPHFCTNRFFKGFLDFFHIASHFFIFQSILWILESQSVGHGLHTKPKFFA